MSRKSLSIWQKMELKLKEFSQVFEVAYKWFYTIATLMNHFPFLTCISTSFIAIITVLYTSAVLQQDLLDIMIIILTLVMSSIKIKCFVPY